MKCINIIFNIQKDLEIKARSSDIILVKKKITYHLANVAVTTANNKTMRDEKACIY